MDSPELLLLWAKSPQRVELIPGEAHYHPLLFHMFDTAMVVGALWNRALAPAIREQFRARLGVESVAIAGQWISFFAGLHDIGKATPPFQQQWSEGWKRLQARGYQPARSCEKKAHYILSSFVLQDLLTKAHVPFQVAFEVAEAVGGHHGLFPSAAQKRYSRTFLGDSRWDEARFGLIQLLALATGVDQLPTLLPGTSIGNSLSVILAGLTSVADWIASDHGRFPFTGDGIDPQDYFTRARVLARQAVDQMGWFDSHAGESAPTFEELFEKSPNRLQKQVMAVAPRLAGPSLVLLEYPMGGGKTEAALYLANYLAAVAGHGGAYFALPTMATSNQMFGRVGRYLTRRYPGSAVNVQLLHGHADLHTEFELLKKTGRGLIHPATVTGKDGWLLAAEWFTYRKRGLLAPYGIGTIDQALLGVLQTKHFFVRLFGLAGKVVILDEVHAYDTYMQILLTRLLTWLAACGASVILLSATLPSGIRQALLTAYAAGRGKQWSVKDWPNYPRLTWVTADGMDSRTIEEADRRQILLRRFSQKDQAWMSELKNVLAEGGCAAVILNTVTRAQAIFGELQQYFEPHELELFHARFPYDDRMEREGMILNRFGPGAADRPYRAVVVATQVIEQSLDLDFDLLVTDLAPIDLLLQRSGRVWRHPEVRRTPQINSPTAWVLMPEVDDAGCPHFDRGAVRVYDAHTLLRTWLALDGRPEVAIPGHVERLVESVYQSMPPQEALPEPIRQFWLESRRQLELDLVGDTKKAQRKYIPDVAEDLFGMGMDELDEEDETLHQAHQAMTRLGGPSVSVVCLITDGARVWASLDRKQVLHLDTPLSDAAVRTLLGRSLRISFSPGLVRRILDEAEDVPPQWLANPHLRRHRLLWFDPQGRCLTAGLPLCLDTQLGLRLTREGEEES